MYPIFIKSNKREKKLKRFRFYIQYTYINSSIKASQIHLPNKTQDQISFPMYKQYCLACLNIFRVNYIHTPFFWKIRFVIPQFEKMTLHSQICKIIDIQPLFFCLFIFLIFLTNAKLTKVKNKNYILIILSLSEKYSFKNQGKGAEY